MSTTIAASAPSTFRELSARVQDAGLLKRRLGYYGLKIPLTVAALGAGWCGLFLIGDSWLALAVAVFLGFTYTQLGFVGHDAGHQQVFRSRRANTVLGLGVGNALIGVSFGWWVPKHSAHHAFPNHVGRDPDLDAALLPAVGAHAPSNGFTRFMTAWQAWLFFPLMAFRSTGLHVLGIRRLLQNRDRSAAIEGLLIAVNAAAYFTLVLLVLSPLKAVAFVVVQQVVFSVYLGCSFAPNHKAMPVYEGEVQMSFERRQVTTARNVRGGLLTNFALGGLNYQIEHHLFPSMPRPNLARAQGIVRSFCIETGLGYREDSLIGSFRDTLRQLHSVTESARTA